MLSAREVRGQTNSELPSTRVFVAGPLSLYPQASLKDMGTDSNVYFESTNPKSDLTYTLTPRLFAVLPIGNTRLRGTGIGDLVYYRTYSDQRSLTGQVEGRYEVTSPGFRPFASAGFVRRAGREGFEIDARARQTQTNLMAGIDMDVTPLTAITAWASRSRTTFDEREQYHEVSLAEQLNRSVDIAAAGGRFRLTPLTTLLVAAEFERERFERAPLRDADSILVAPTIDIDPGGTLSGDVRAGFRAFTPRDPELSPYRGLIGSARLHYAVFSLTRVDVEANRDVTFSFDPNQPYYLESGGRLTVTQRVLGPLDVIGIAERRDLRSQRLGGTSFDGRREITSSIGGGVAVQIQTQIRCALTYERTERTSSEPIGRNYERTRVLGSISYGL
jgi:hypothetical protein